MHDALLWSDRLEALARPVLAACPLDADATSREKQAYADRFRDECGVRRPTDDPLLAELLQLPPDSQCPPQAGSSHPMLAWNALRNPDEPGLDAYLNSRGPLVPALRDEGIESWTETELSELHALSAHAMIHNDPAARHRCQSAIEWHLAELQPDNGTNRPWALHAFVWFSAQLPDAILHARTLVHNACVERGRPERRSALILMHSARVLRASAPPPA